MFNLTLEQKRKIIRITTIVGIILTITGSIYIGHSDYFKPGGGFEVLLRHMGIFAPIIFVFVQISQIIYPIIPFGLTNVLGDLIFGHVLGFCLNAIGMVIGSTINFYIGKRYGGAVVRAFISDEEYDKYISKMNQGKMFMRLLRVGFIAPIFPDDIFCMIAGMSNLTFRQFFGMVLAYRPISMFVYTFMTSSSIRYIYDFFN